LTAAWHKYGKEAFEFVVLEKVPERDLHSVEQKYLTICEQQPETNYNLNYAPDGGRPSPEAIEKISVALKGRKFTEAHKKKIGAANRRREYSAEMRRKVGEFSATRVHSEETRKKIGDAQRGRKRSHATREKMSESGKGKHNHVGERNPNYDHQTYCFSHEVSDDVFCGTRQEFIRTHGVSASMVSSLVGGKRELAKGWRASLTERAE